MSRAVMVRTGLANRASVRAALRRAGCEVQESDDPQVVSSASRVVLPGVGAFGPAMERLRGPLAQALRAHIDAERPLLAVCLGLQLLCEGSEESPGVQGLGVLPGSVRRFDSALITPQMGWNRVQAQPECALLQSGHAYFANTYHLPDTDPQASLPEGFSVARCDYGGAFIAALERGSLLACQFHPELSGAWGAQLIERWLQRSTS